MLSLALLVRLATRVTSVEASRVSVCGLLLAHVPCMLTFLKHWCYLTLPPNVDILSGGCKVMAAQYIPSYLKVFTLSLFLM